MNVCLRDTGVGLSSPEKHGPKKPEALWEGVGKSEGKHTSPSSILLSSVIVLKLTPAVGSLSTGGLKRCDVRLAFI